MPVPGAGVIWGAGQAEAQITVATPAGRRTGIFRLATTLLDSRAYPAADLIRLYHQRWTTEPTDNAEPTEPMDSTEPRDPIERNESCDRTDHRDEPGPDESLCMTS